MIKKDYCVPKQRKESKQAFLFDVNDDESLSPVEFAKSSTGSDVVPAGGV